VDKLLVSREQLIYTITHDIKAPIGSIMGFLDLLSEDEPTPKQQYYVDNMNSSAHHILDLVKNLLDFQSLEKNRQQLSLMPFLLYSFIKDTYESFLPVAEKNKLKINLETNIQANNKYLSDPYRIRQILNNLISNAIKFTPENGTILISAATDKQNRLRVSVKDTGPGIDDTDKSIIFEEFTRLEDTRESVEGTGLGLTISKKLAILLGGNIELESVKGEGSDFILTIPITPFIEESSSSSKNTDSKGTLQEKIRVLFVDDDVTQLNFVSELMKKAGLTYTCCSKATEALQLLQEESFNIIFTDIQMPEIKGFDLVKKIRESTFADSATIPVIGLSADNKWHEQYKEAGFTGFVLKPFKTKQLLDVIKKYSSKTQTNIKYSGRFEFNFDSLMQFISDDREVALKMIDSFIEETDKNLKLLKTAFQKDDWDTIKELSHKMSSLMKMVSANKIVSILILFEKGSQSKEKEVTLCRLIEKIIKEAKEAKWKVQLKS
jgi:CheY-like chemotaxis protein/HPt (histidine-containing phosphotransfer) domain-containing protein